LPACITHLLAARAALRKIESEELHQLIAENFHAYIWGSQGPDLLMHGGYFPWHKISNLVLIGGRMHKELIDETFDEFYKYAKNTKSKHDFEILLAYVLGYITHHSVDKIFHPYVYDTIGCMSKRFKRMTESILHYKVEENIDVALLEWLYHETPLQFTAYNLLMYHEEICLPIAHMYHHVLDTRFGRKVPPKEIMNAFKDMRFLQKSLFDPYGIICTIVSFLQNLTGNDVQLSYMTHRSRLDNKFDYCNFNHRIWHNAYDPTFSSREDIFQLFDRSCQDAVEKIDTFYRYLQENRNDLNGLFENISFNSGLPIGNKK
jgi:hypothetical protein